MSESRGDPLLPPPRDDHPAPAPRAPRERSPNYAARRLLVSAIAVVVVAVGALAAWRYTGGDDGGGGVVAAEWDEFVLVDRAGGSIETFDSSGRTGIQLDVGDRIRRVEAGGDRLALITNEAIILTAAQNGGTATFGIVEPEFPTVGTIAPSATVSPDATPGAATTLPNALATTTTAAPTTTTTIAPGATIEDPTGAIRVAIPVGSTVRRLPVEDQLVLAVGTNAGGNTLIVRGDGEVIDVGALAGQADPFHFLDTVTTNREGTHVAVADARNFQTIVVTDAETEPTYFPDQPIAMGESLIATSQVVGQRAEIALFDLDGERRTSVSSDVPVGATFADDRLVYVTEEAVLHRLEPGDDDPTEVAELAVPGTATVTSVSATAGGERLVVAGSTFETIIDLDGDSQFTTTFASATTVAIPSYDAVCLVVGDETNAHSLVRLDDGTTVADLDGDIVASAADRACATVVVRAQGTLDQYVLVTENDEAELGTLGEAHLAPDGRSVIVVTATGVAQLVPIDEDGTLGEPIDLRSPTPGTIDVAFLDR